MKEVIGDVRIGGILEFFRLLVGVGEERNIKVGFLGFRE